VGKPCPRRWVSRVRSIGNTDGNTDDSKINITMLELLKSYNIPFDIIPINNMSLDTLDTLDNLNNQDNQHNLSNIIIKIDEIVISNTIRIKSILQKSEKSQMKTNIQIDNIRQNNNINISNNKVFSYKDTYKIEKNKKTELLNKYNELQILYNNYELVVINQIENEHNTNLLELDYHKIRATERLNIMKDRLQNNYQQNKSILEDQIKSNHNNLLEHNNRFIKLKQQLEEINNNLLTLNKNKTELQKIDTKINEYTQLLGIIQNDIDYLELSK
jgi:hypothetical protein